MSRFVDAALLVVTCASVGLMGCGDKELKNPTEGSVMCPGSNQSCMPGTCCPGFDATADKSFPCPTSTFSTTKCDGDQSTLVDAVLASLTRKEKYLFLRGVGWKGYDPEEDFYIGNAGGNLTRYGIPSLNMQDSGNGFRNDYITRWQSDKSEQTVTGFPAALNLASTWDEELASKYGAALAQELRAKGANVLLGPAVEVHRVPRNGRNVEYISGESGYLGARLVKPFIRAVQSQKVLCSVKHFIGNHQETCRRNSNSVIDNRTRYETYYPPFEAAFEADVATVMCGYNQINDEWNCGSAEVLKHDMRKKLGFAGWVQSDWWAFRDFDLGRKGGVDQEMPGTAINVKSDFIVVYTDENLDAKLDLPEIDAMVRPQLTYMFKYGLAEPSEDTVQFGPECRSKMMGDASTATRRALAREMATKAVVLLKNDNSLLPLRQSAEVTLKIAVLGSFCDIRPNLADMPTNWYGRDPLIVGGSGKVIPKTAVTVLDALESMCSDSTVNCKIVNSTTDDNAGSALEIAEEQVADVAIICGATAAGEELDRDSLSVDNEAFMVSISDNIRKSETLANTKIVALTMTPGTIVMPWISKVDAAMTVFAPSQFYGHAFVDNLFGKYNPSAKSPIYYPKIEDGTLAPVYPTTVDKWQCDQLKIPLKIKYEEGLNIAWHSDDAKTNTLFPFGHGMSYTSFKYSSMKSYTNPKASDLSNPEICGVVDKDKPNPVLCISVNVQNTGKIAGVEIAQLYMSYPSGLGEPAKVLRGFVRLQELPPEASAQAGFAVYPRDMQTYDGTAGEWKNHIGETYTFYAGKDAADEGQKLTYTGSQTGTSWVSV